METQAAVKPKNMTWQFCIFQGLYWMSCCSLFGYTTVFLLGRGYTGGQIGIITATASVCSAILQPVFAGIAGGSKKISMVNVMTLIGLFNMLMDGVLILCPQNFFITAALFICLSVSNSCIMPLTNSVAFAFEKLGLRMDFGIGRGIGSLTFGIASTILGYLVKDYGVNVVLISGACMMALSLIWLRLFFPNVALGTLHQKQEEKPAAGIKKSKAGFFKRYPHLFVVFTGIAFCAMGSSLIANYLIAIVEGVGGDSGTMGFMQALAAYLEIPAMFGFTLLAKKFGISRLLSVAVVFTAFKSFLLTTANSIEMVFIATLMQLFGWGLYIPASVEFAKASTEPEDQVQAQGVFSAFSMVSSVLANLSGGIIVQYFGVPVLTYTAVTVGAIGAVIVLIFGRTRKEKKHVKSTGNEELCLNAECQAGGEHRDGQLSAVPLLGDLQTGQETGCGMDPDSDLGETVQPICEATEQESAQGEGFGDVENGQQPGSADHCGSTHRVDPAAGDSRPLHSRAKTVGAGYIRTSGVPRMRTRKLRLSGLLRRIQKSAQSLRNR